MTRTIFKHKMYVDTRDITLAPHILLEGYWEMWITKALLRELKEGMNIIEVGANVGYYSLIISSRIGDTGKLYAFEANPDTFQILHDNVEVNGLSSRVVLGKKAVIDKAKKITFHKSTKYRGGSSIVELSEFSQYDGDLETVDVEGISLDDYFRDKNVAIDLVKIDAEGSEPLIFDGMKNLIDSNANMIIICEFNAPLISAVADPRKFLERILSCGFILRYVDQDAIPKEISIEKLLNMGVVDLYLKRN